MFPKKFISLYLDDPKFLITRCCWRVEYTFKQARFKRKFVLFN